MKVIFIILLYITGTFILISSKRIVIPFKKYYPSNSDSLFTKYFSNNLGISINFGSPSQSLILNIEFTNHLLWVIGHETNLSFPNYNHTQSSTSKRPKQFILIFKDSKLQNAIDLLDTISLSDNSSIEIKDFQFQYGTKVENMSCNSGAVGLAIHHSNIHNINSNIINQLKERDLISSYAFMIKYNTKTEGELIIGEYPHEYHQEDKALRNKMKVYRPAIFDSNLKWGLMFKSVSYDGIVFEKKALTEFQIELGFILGSSNYENIMTTSLFTQENNLCEVIVLENKYKAYQCDKKFHSNKFKELMFDIDNVTNFRFDKEDLFIEENGKVLFMVFFPIDNSNNNNWILGEPFFRKYNIVFDQDRKIIAYYNDNSLNEKGSLMKISKIFLGMTVLILLGFIMGYYFINKRHSYRKKKMINNESIQYKIID